MTRMVDAAIFEEGPSATIRSLALESIRDDEVLVRIVASGICHTDVVFSEGFMKPDYPIVLGHEGAGIVEEIGRSIVNLAPGDHVILTFLSCGRCHNCKAGRPAGCVIMGELNCTGHRDDGSDPLSDERGPIASHFFGQSSFATYSVAKARNVVKVRDDAPLALLAPLGCGIQTGAGAVFNVLRSEAGDSFLLFGAGSVGMSALMAAKRLGCSPIVVVEPQLSRRELALSLGADAAFDPSGEDNLAATLRAVTGHGFRFAADTSGIPAAIGTAIAALANCGSLALLTSNAIEASINLNLLDLSSRSIAIHGCCEGASDAASFLTELADMVMDGSFPLDRIVRYYPFEKINEAVADMNGGKVVKPILLMPGTEAFH